VNFDDAIQAHAGWKIKLADYFKHPGRMIGNGSEFAKASQSVIKAIRTLKAKVE
jgi:hypothetical protein